MAKPYEEKKKNVKWDERSTERTARFVAGRLQTIQDDLADLLAEFRAVEKFDHLIDLAILVKYIARIQKQCEKAGEGYEWKEED
jgi:hypothetical protein